MLVGHQGIGHGHALDVPGKDLGPLGVDLVAQQEALAAHSSGDLSGLAAGGSTKVADLLTGLGIQQGHRCHGTGLL